MRMNWFFSFWMLVLLGAAMAITVQTAHAQESTPAAPASATPDPAVLPAPVAAAGTSAAVSAPTPDAASLPAMGVPIAVAVGSPATGKAAKAGSKAPKAAPVVCPGSDTLQEQPETPMLDEEGKQRLDTDGQPIFNPAVSQQRGKKGKPLFDTSCRPVFQTAVDKGYTDKGKKIRASRVKIAKTVPMVITRGTFTVDGMIGKAELNYSIADLKFVYLYAPGIGTVVVSNSPFAGATVQKDAFQSNGSPKMSTLTIKVKTGDEEHVLQLASEKPMLAKPGRSEPAYVQLDREFMLPSKYPVVGYGKVEHSPYVWPGAKPNTQIAGIVKPPPTPANLRPVMLLAACPAGQMRRPAAAALPGQIAHDQPCVSIAEQKKQQGAEPAIDGAEPGTEPVAASTAPSTSDSAPVPAASPAALDSATPPSTKQ
jgi:hypothetical protein